MNAARERIKSILQCFDEWQFEKAREELKSSQKVIPSLVLKFLDNTVYLCTNKFFPASKQFKVFLKQIEELSDGINQIEGSKTTFELLQEVERLDQQKKEYGTSRGMKENETLILLESFPKDTSCVEVFEQFFSEEDPSKFLQNLLSSRTYRVLSYDLFLETFETIFELSDLNKKNEHLMWLSDLIKRIEPTENNEHKNGDFYVFGKRKLNELVFLNFYYKGEINNGFDWFESETGGMNFLLFYKVPHESNPFDKSPLFVMLDRFSFVINEGYFPYPFHIKSWANMHGVFDSYGLKDHILLEQKFIKNQASLDFYLNIIDRIKNDFSSKEKLFNRAYSKAVELLKIEKEEEDIKEIFFPIKLAQILEEQGKYDLAIRFYERVNANDSIHEEAIERCKYKRDGFILDQLKENLRSLNESEQKQLLAYNKVFQIEVKLRKLVDDVITKVHGNGNWWKSYVENKELFQYMVKEVRKRKSDFESIPFDREELKKYKMIDFTTFLELKEIVGCYYDKFKECFGDKEIFFGKIKSIHLIRLDVAHARLIDNKQLQKLSDECQEINKVIDRYYEKNYPPR